LWFCTLHGGLACISSYNIVKCGNNFRPNLYRRFNTVYRTFLHVYTSSLEVRTTTVPVYHSMSDRRIANETREIKIYTSITRTSVSQIFEGISSPLHFNTHAQFFLRLEFFLLPPNDSSYRGFAVHNIAYTTTIIVLCWRPITTAA